METEAGCFHQGGHHHHLHHRGHCCDHHLHHLHGHCCHHHLDWHDQELADARGQASSLAEKAAALEQEVAQSAHAGEVGHPYQMVFNHFDPLITLFCSMYSVTCMEIENDGLEMFCIILHEMWHDCFA